MSFIINLKSAFLIEKINFNKIVNKSNMKNLKRNSLLVVVMFLANSPFINAQEDFGPPPPPQEAVPINDFIIPFFIVAVLMGAYFFYATNKKVVANK